MREEVWKGFRSGGPVRIWGGRVGVETLGCWGGWGSCCQTPPPTPTTRRCRQNIIGSNLEYFAQFPIQKWDFKNFCTKWILWERALVELSYILFRGDTDHLQGDLMALPVSVPKKMGRASWINNPLWPFDRFHFLTHQNYLCASKPIWQGPLSKTS